MKIGIAFCLTMALFSQYHSQEQRQGIVIVHTYFFDYDSSSTKPPVDISYKIWFKNNRSIQEVPHLIFTEDSSGNKASFKIKHYSYLDPDENVCYNYESFSDTSKILMHYADIDSIAKKGGWNFYSNEKFKYERSAKLSDTTINNIIYGRVRLDKKVNGNSVYLITFFRCDKKESLIKVFKNLSDSIGCPIIRDDSFIKNKLFMTRELEFISDKLSEEESKIFEAWERNVKKHSASK